jgi:hypothetical protein
VGQLQPSLARSRTGFEAELSKEPEPTAESLDATIDQIRLAPYVLRKALPEALREVSKVFPYDPGGRRRALLAADCRYVCEEIGRLVSRGILKGVVRLVLRDDCGTQLTSAVRDGS